MGGAQQEADLDEGSCLVHVRLGQWLGRRGRSGKQGLEVVCGSREGAHGAPHRQPGSGCMCRAPLRRVTCMSWLPELAGNHKRQQSEDTSSRERLRSDRWGCILLADRARGTSGANGNTRMPVPSTTASTRSHEHTCGSQTSGSARHSTQLRIAMENSDGFLDVSIRLLSRCRARCWGADRGAHRG